MDPVTVLVVDDHAMVAEGLRAVLDSQPDIAVIDTAATLRQAYAVVATEPVDVVLLDLRLPDGSGIDGIKHIRQLSPTTHVVVVTAHADDTVLLTAVEAGCAGFLTKASDMGDAIAAVRAAAAGEALMPPDVLTRLLPRLRSPKPTIGADLTPRERQILLLIGQGLTNVEIAHRLTVSVHTVRNHVQNILAKLGVHSKLEALAVAVREGLIQSS